MKDQNYLITLLVVTLLASIGYSCAEDRNVNAEIQNTDRHLLECVLVDDVWKIVDRQDPDRTEIVVSRGDTVVWYAPENRDIYFQFMDRELTGEYTREVLKGDSVTITIGENAETGEHPYAVFVYDAREYARGESPPRLFIRD